MGLGSRTAKAIFPENPAYCTTSTLTSGARFNPDPTARHQMVLKHEVESKGNCSLGRHTHWVTIPRKLPSLILSTILACHLVGIGAALLVASIPHRYTHSRTLNLLSPRMEESASSNAMCVHHSSVNCPARAVRIFSDLPKGSRMKTRIHWMWCGPYSTLFPPSPLFPRKEEKREKKERRSGLNSTRLRSNVVPLNAGFPLIRRLWSRGRERGPDRATGVKTQMVSQR